MKKHLVIDNPTVSNIIFYPQKSPIPSQLDPNTEILNFKVEKKVSLGGFFFLNNINFPTIFLFHGNGELAIDYRSIAPVFFESKVNLAVIDYRGYGFSSGQPYFTSLINDAPIIYQQFIDWADKRGLSKSIFILGRSLGSVCAAEIGSQNPECLRGIIFESGFANLYNVMTHLFRISSSEVTPTSMSEYSNDTRIRQIKKPVLIIHGTTDFIIPSGESELIYKNLSIEIDKSLVLIDGAGHNDILMYHDKYFDPLSEFIEKFK
ncbi:MAG: alpha/beta hydrolase [Promethearchaeota archaeon]